MVSLFVFGLLVSHIFVRLTFYSCHQTQFTESFDFKLGPLKHKYYLRGLVLTVWI